MNIDQIGIQLFTLRDHCKTPTDFAETCRRVAEIGYRTVQVSGIDREVIPETEIARICADHGLVICASHEHAPEIIENPSRTVRRLQDLGTKITAYPMGWGVDFGKEAEVAAMIKGLDNAGKVFAAADLVLAYHNHHFEFRRLDGRLIFERIFAETQPTHLQGEIDTYWVQYGGGDPIDWCKRLKGRLPIIHLKDYIITEENKIAFCEVGHGNLDIPGIIQAAESSGCEWFVVEQDSCPGDPFESIAKSFNYLKALAFDIH